MDDGLIRAIRGSFTEENYEAVSKARLESALAGAPVCK
jgi:hypothetical protein